jgi:hypothetical protein
MDAAVDGTVALQAGTAALLPNIPLSAESLSGMKMSELRKHAVDVGVSRDDIARAIDSDQPKRILIDMVVQLAQHQAQGMLLLAAELRELRQSALEERAQLEGVSEHELERAIDDDGDPKGAIIRLIVQHRNDRAVEHMQMSGAAGRTGALLPDELMPVCPFCANRSLSSRAVEPVPAGRTRQRRELKSERKTPKWGRWWRQFGYNGPKCELRLERESGRCAQRASPLLTRSVAVVRRLPALQRGAA